MLLLDTSTAPADNNTSSVHLCNHRRIRQYLHVFKILGELFSYATVNNPTHKKNNLTHKKNDPTHKKPPINLETDSGNKPS